MSSTEEYCEKLKVRKKLVQKSYLMVDYYDPSSMLKLQNYLLICHKRLVIYMLKGIIG